MLKFSKLIAVTFVLCCLTTGCQKAKPVVDVSSFDDPAVGEFINQQEEAITAIIDATENKKMDFSTMAKVQSMMYSSASKQNKFLKNITDADRAKYDSFNRITSKRIQKFVKKFHATHAQAANR